MAFIKPKFYAVIYIIIFSPAVRGLKEDQQNDGATTSATDAAVVLLMCSSDKCMINVTGLSSS